MTSKYDESQYRRSWNTAITDVDPILAKKFKTGLEKFFLYNFENPFYLWVTVCAEGECAQQKGRVQPVQAQLTRMDVDVLWEQKCWDQAWAKRGDLKRDEEADLTSRAKEKRMRVEEGASRGGRGRRAQLYGERVYVQRTRRGKHSYRTRRE
jgi:hypothetical protein